MSNEHRPLVGWEDDILGNRTTAPMRGGRLTRTMLLLI